MLPLYVQNEMYRKSLLLDTEASTRTENASLTAGGDGRELNKLCVPVLSIFTICGLEEHIQEPMKALQTHYDSLSHEWRMHSGGVRLRVSK